MTPPLGAMEILKLRADLTAFATRFAERAHNTRLASDPAERQSIQNGVQSRCVSLLDDWLNIVREMQQKSGRLQYQQETGNAQRLLYEFLHPDLPGLPQVRKRFRANRSMRDVEPYVDISVKNLND